MNKADEVWNIVRFLDSPEYRRHFAERFVRMEEDLRMSRENIERAMSNAVTRIFMEIDRRKFIAESERYLEKKESEGE